MEINERLGRQSGIASCIKNLGEVAYAKGQYDHAQEMYEKALEINERLGRQSGIAIRRKKLDDLSNDSNLTPIA